MLDFQPTDRLLNPQLSEVSTSGRFPHSVFQNLQSSDSQTLSNQDSYALQLSNSLTENDTDFNFPSEHDYGEKLRRTVGCLESVVLITDFVYGIVVLFYEDLFVTWRTMYFYVLVAITADVGITFIAGFFLCCAYCIGGINTRNHIKPCTGIFIQLFGISGCYILFGYSLYFIFEYYDTLYKHHRVLSGFITLETLVTFVYSVLALPTVCGAISYFIHKIQRKIRRIPLVEFHQPQRPNWFAVHFGLNRLGQHLGQSRRPTREEMIQLRQNIEDFKEPEFKMGEEIVPVTETPM